MSILPQYQEREKPDQAGGMGNLNKSKSNFQNLTSLQKCLFLPDSESFELTSEPDVGKAAHECVSEEALVHLKSYKYSSVDKSLISKYILQHYVRNVTSIYRLPVLN